MIKDTVARKLHETADKMSQSDSSFKKVSAPSLRVTASLVESVGVAAALAVGFKVVRLLPVRAAIVLGGLAYFGKRQLNKSR